MELEPYTEELRGCPVKGNAYPVLVLGVGNPLMGDDGIGVELAHRLQERDYGPLVHVEEGGTLGMTLLPLLEDADTVILLDAVKTGPRPEPSSRAAGTNSPAISPASSHRTRSA